MVYVDPLFYFPSSNPQAYRVGERHGHMWSHLWADTAEELHKMAGLVGMQRSWFQDKPGFPHYDLVPPRRALAVKLGAREASLSEWLRKHPIHPQVATMARAILEGKTVAPANQAGKSEALQMALVLAQAGENPDFARAS